MNSIQSRLLAIRVMDRMSKMAENNNDKVIKDGNKYEYIANGKVIMVSELKERRS